MSARFEIVRVDGGWFVRFIAANNRIVWVTPGLYSRRRAAVRAIESITGHIVELDDTGELMTQRDCNVTDYVRVRDADERGTR